MKSLVLFALTLLLAAIVASTTKAAVTTYTNRSSYLAASSTIGTTTTIDFSTKDDGSPITNPSNDVYFETLNLRGVSFKDLRSYWNLFIYNYPSATIRVELPPNTFALGADLTDFYNVGLIYTVKLSTGETFSFPPITRDWEFFGVISDTPIQWAEFSLTNDYMAFDNFTFTVKPFTDTDGDGVQDSDDNCPSVRNDDQADNDSDGQGDACDDDDDNDGIRDGDDAFPLDPRESVDTDGDGIGNNADIDDDNDGFSDSTETSAGSDPLNSASTPEICDGRDNDLNDGVDEGFTNTDGDDMADCVDPDDDNDGVADASDNCPLTPNPDQADFDLDGVGDTCDAQTGPPRNKEQCKDDGWMRFNTPRAFKNQGDCIQFVNTGK